jgi:excisionase family DNA binding protein
MRDIPRSETSQVGQEIPSEAKPSAIMTTEEVAAYLRVSSACVKRRAMNGEIPGKKIGIKWRFSRKAIEELF